MPTLAEHFDGAMFTIYRRAKEEAKYNAEIFFKMLNERRGVATAKFLINSPKESTGYTELFLRKRLDLTVEAMVIEDKRWHSLFTEDELDKARKRLAKHNYQPKASA
jgi:hypothetical protein